ncbi:MAG: cobalamin biosynthesis protein CobQ [Pseudomonadota bacterium]
MNTIAHMVLASAALARRDQAKKNWAALAGAIAPDASMFVFFGWSLVQGWSGDETWNVQYWTQPWQTLGAISNSFILFGLLLAFTLWRNRLALTAFSAAALLHLGLDFPLHADDAHRHFWPLTDWRFVSPVSYWDPDQNGLIGSAFETLLTLLATGILWLRFQALRWRALLLSLAALQSLSFALQVAWIVNR